MIQNNYIKNLNGVIGLFGLGKSNLDILTHLQKDTEVILRTEEKIPPLPETAAKIIKIYEGDSAFSEPEEDILILSPSVRRDRKELLPFKRLGIKFTSDHELFFERVKAPVFAVSGSDGKSTTTALTSLLLSEKFGKSPAIGNIGVPMMGALLKNSGAYAAELSSFMLSYGRFSLFRGAITNISENHLNWHKDFEEYVSAKLSLLTRAAESIAPSEGEIFSRYLRGNSAYGIFSLTDCYEELKSKYHAQVFYTLDDGYIKRNKERLLSLSDFKKTDKNHLKNFMCSLALTDGYVTRKRMLEVAREFEGLPHRAERFFSIYGIDFIDSSIDTTPTRTAETIRSLDRRAVILLGGRGKGLSYEPLIEPVKKYAEAVIIYGENRDLIKETLGEIPNVFVTDGLEQAAELGLSTVKRGSCLLLSPASSSYDGFINFEERGNKFKEIILNNFK